MRNKILFIRKCAEYTVEYADYELAQSVEARSLDARSLHAGSFDARNIVLLPIIIAYSTSIIFNSYCTTYTKRNAFKVIYTCITMYVA